MNIQRLPSIEPVVDMPERTSMIETALVIRLQFFTAMQFHMVEIEKAQAEHLARHSDVDFKWQYDDPERGVLIICAGF